jgi:hypothetical protein
MAVETEWLHVNRGLRRDESAKKPVKMLDKRVKR